MIVDCTTITIPLVLQAADPATNWLQTLSGWLQIASPIVSWLLVIAGWHIVNRGHTKREKRKEIKAMITEAVSRSEGIAEMAREYHEQEPGHTNSKQAARIRSELKTLATEVKNLKASSENKIDAEEALIQLRQATTGGHFDSMDRSASPPDSEVFCEIDEAVINFHRQLTTAFTNFR